MAWKETDNLIREQELKLAYARLEGRNVERERVARELHDGLGGTLSTVKLRFGLLEQKLERLGEGISEQFFTVSKMLDTLHASTDNHFRNALVSKITELA